jgi:hypothetical protein
MFVEKLIALAIFWHFFHLSSCSLSHVKYASLNAITGVCHWRDIA